MSTLPIHAYVFLATVTLLVINTLKGIWHCMTHNAPQNSTNIFLLSPLSSFYIKSHFPLNSQSAKRASLGITGKNPVVMFISDFPQVAWVY